MRPVKNKCTSHVSSSSILGRLPAASPTLLPHTLILAVRFCVYPFPPPPHFPREVVRKGLDDTLPSNAHEIMNNREGTVSVGITQLFPRPKGVIVSEFESRDDLIDVLLGSW